jgi:lipopolysaccharide export system permease protein
MKILDRYILKTYLITFTSVFVILFFIFILQTVWLFISELAGKDLDFGLIINFLMYSMPGLIPMVLPLTVLLSSIMTFGDLAENYEFAAMKSAGISFWRSIQGLVIFIAVLSIGAFIFANNVIPYSQFKFVNFRKNIAQVKPAMAIAEGQFSTIGSISIKVNKKTGENGEFLQGITIHKKSANGEGAKTVIKAEKGELVSKETSSILQLVLKKGYYYEDIVPAKYEDRNKIPFAKVYFKEYTMNNDLSKLNSQPGLNDKISSSDNMLNFSELKYTIDSLSSSYNKELVSVAENAYQRTGVATPIQTYGIINADSLKIQHPKTPDLLKILNQSEKSRILDIAFNDVTSTKSNIEINNMELSYKKKNIYSHWVAIYDKFVIGFACILMFFIGAPLGSIIRKGGLGLPIVFAMLIFISFHFINTFGKRLAQEGGITPFLGSWASTLILLPLGIYLTQKAIKDNGDVNFDRITDPIKKIFLKFKSKKII